MPVSLLTLSLKVSPVLTSPDEKHPEQTKSSPTSLASFHSDIQGIISWNQILPRVMEAYLTACLTSKVPRDSFLLLPVIFFSQTQPHTESNC